MTVVTTPRVWPRPRRPRLQGPGRVVASEYLHRTGPPDDRLDLIILGDGYTLADLPAYREAARAAADRVLGTEPFRAYRSLINVLRVDVVSPERGITDSRAGHYPVTALATTHDFVSPHAIGTLRPWRISLLCRGVARDVVLVLANSRRRGGAAIPFTRYAFCTAPAAFDHDSLDRPAPLRRRARAELRHAFPGPGTPPYDPHYPGDSVAYACDTVVHELGHVCGANLADEYATPLSEHVGPGLRTRLMQWMIRALGVAERVTGAALFPNVTFNPRRPPWRHWLTDPASNVAVLEGALGMPKGVYRPQQQCKMIRERDDFCVVCREAIICRAIYRFARPARLTYAPAGAGRYRYEVEVASGLSAIGIDWVVGGRLRPDLRGRREVELPENASAVRALVTDEHAWIRSRRPSFALRAATLATSQTATAVPGGPDALQASGA